MQGAKGENLEPLPPAGESVRQLVSIHPIQTGTVQIKSMQRRGRGHGFFGQVNMLLDRSWTEPLPIYAWLIEHPEGLLLVDTGETARIARGLTIRAGILTIDSPSE